MWGCEDVRGYSVVLVGMGYIETSIKSHNQLSKYTPIRSPTQYLSSAHHSRAHAFHPFTTAASSHPACGAWEQYIRRTESNSNQPTQPTDQQKNHSAAASSPSAQTSPRPSRPVPLSAKGTPTHLPRSSKRGRSGAEKRWRRERAGSAPIEGWSVRELTVPAVGPHR